MEETDRPIIIIGGTRSGTTMLSRLLARAPGLCLWYEPNVIWRIGSAYRDDDSAFARDARPWVRRRIHRLFDRYTRAHGGARIVEKTPQNVLRIPFIDAVFPEAVFVHIFRDGRANLRSQVEQFDSFRPYSLHDPGTKRLILRRLASIPWWEWPAYAPRMLEGVWRRYVSRGRNGWWGVRYPGWKRDRARLSAPEIAARQWVVAVERAFADLEPIGPDRCIHVRYEDITRDPEPWFRRVLDLCDVEADGDFFRHVREAVHPDSIERWRDELDPHQLEIAMPIMGRLLHRLGYLEANDAPEPEDQPAAPRAR